MPHRFVIALWLAGAEFLRPTADSVVKPGPLSVIVKGQAQLEVDGKPVPAEHPAAGVTTATVNLAPGPHRLSAGGTVIQVTAGGAGKEFRVHPPAAGCPTCHVIKDGAWEFRYGACFGCHDPKAFPKTHQHNTEVLADCQTCHYPHGSTVQKHLKMPKEIACKQCHG